MPHLWAGKAVYHKQPLQFIYISSIQAIEPEVSVPGYVVANWAVLKLPEVLKVNLGRSAEIVNASCLMLPFVHTGMTEAYADNPKVFGRWQQRMLEPFEAAHGATQLLGRAPEYLDLGDYKLGVSCTAEEIALKWTQIKIDVNEQELD